MNDACILCVDDEINILQALKRLLRRENYRLLTATGGEEALHILETEEVHLILCDQRMPGMSGTEFFSRVRESWPHILRIILSGYTDVDSITEAINKGHIYKFLLKPWNDQNLRLEIRQALEQYALARTNRQLQQTILEQNEALRHSNENLEQAVLDRTRELKLQNHALALSRAVLETLPFPVIGISSDGLIAVANASAMHLFGHRPGFSVGGPATRAFSADITEATRLVIEKNTACRIHLPEEQTHLTITPLTGRFQGAGAVLIFGVPCSSTAS